MQLIRKTNNNSNVIKFLENFPKKIIFCYEYTAKGKDSAGYIRHSLSYCGHMIVNRQRTNKTITWSMTG